RHEYASQLNMYLNYFKAEVMQPDDNPPIGILLCTEKGDTLVKYATAENPTDNNKLVLTINRQPIGEWFGEQWGKLKQGLYNSVQTEKRGRGFRM
ncbi:MAG: PDDEXK nuclease domain-containing protein, partial [Erysipelotrichaceae bacterium]|nr:PDDEXK nuclease domain-containing protein [Erysipelotrichaceae bacterium]